jgi:superfamily II DNA/RNA helicase
MVDNIKRLGIDTPSPIQDQAIAHAIAGRDVIGLAETGTGKTAAFLLPLIHKTLADGKRNGQCTLILAPTRELALQIEEEFKKFRTPFLLRSAVCVGGTNVRSQIGALRRNPQFIIGTPGRIQDLFDRGFLNLSNVTNVVLDEADRMLDMGFIHDMRSILSEVPKENRQTLFFSATMTSEADRLVNDFLVDPITIQVKKSDVTKSIKQDVVPYHPDNKLETLALLLNKPEFKRVIVFCERKHAAERLTQSLKGFGIRGASIHGDKSHGERQRALRGFKEGRVQVLVATDVAARGIHVDNVTHVINYDLPGTFEDYVHRIGRTGRGNDTGEALTFIESQDTYDVGPTPRAARPATTDVMAPTGRRYAAGKRRPTSTTPAPTVHDDSYEAGEILVAGAD